MINNYSKPLIKKNLKSRQRKNTCYVQRNVKSSEHPKILKEK